MKKILLLLICLACCQATTHAQGKHSPSSRYPSYQGWFRAEGDGSNSKELPVRVSDVSNK